MLESNSEKTDRSVIKPAESVPMGVKFGYSVGDLGANLVFHTIGFYLMFFFTDVFGIVPAMAGVIFLYSKSWDAVSDPIMGYIVDHTSSRWGKMRPYLLFGAIPLGIVFSLLFYAPDIAAEYRVTYGLITFIAFSTAITVVNIPYLAMTPSLTMNSHERSVVTGYRVFFGILGALIAAGATLPLVGLFGDGNQIQGFRMTGLLYAIIVVVLTLITFGTVKERIHVASQEQFSLKDAFKMISQNRPFLLLTVGTLMHMIGMNVMAVVVNYYFKYNLNAEAMIPIAFLSLFVTAAVSLPLFVVISKKTSKKFAYNLGMGIVIGVLVLIYFFGNQKISMGDVEFPLIIIFLILAGVGLSTNWLSPWSMIPDTVEYSQWQTGLRREGIIYGIFYFVFKFGTALAGFFVGSVLTWVGYVANVEQTARTLFGIKSVMTLIPIVFITLGIIIISFYPISTQLHQKILQELAAKGKNETLI